MSKSTIGLPVEGVDSELASATYKSLIQISLEGFRYLAILNGATWLTLLVFARKGGVSALERGLVKTTIALFIVSMSLTAMCYLGSWLTQLSLYNESQRIWAEGRHKVPMWLTFVVFIIAAIVYLVAAILALDAL